MPPPSYSKPENVLKRAQELVAVGQNNAALSLLHELITSKRSRNSPIASLQPAVELFIELAVDLKKGKLAKDGLYQFKNAAQNVNVGSIEVVFKKFIDLSEQKVAQAQEKSDQVQSTISTANIDDLEASETPESILLSTVSGEQSKDRTDREIVTPWLKFLWETYRTVLDILKNNSRLEIMYQSTAREAFQFCSKYSRKTEFRRLCELLRNHLQNAAKYSAQMHGINLNDADTLQRHLETRFHQLNVAVELELWQEAFRSTEDIHTLLNLSRRPAKNVVMANYFEKLARIFLVSENFLFHAASWNRYYNLLGHSIMAVASGQSKKDNPTVNEATMTNAASFVLLSALSIPVISTSRSRGALVDVDEAKKNKNARLTNLLGMSQPPTRSALLKDALNKGLLKRARPEIRELYNILEVDFHPLSICKRISPILTQVGANPDMQKYVMPLQQVILTRLFQQLSQVYDSVDINFVMNLAQFPEPFEVNRGTIEKFIMNGCKKGDLAIRVDHASGVLTFDSDIFSSAKALHPGPGAALGSADSDSGSVQRLQSTPAEIVRTTLTRLAKTLYITCQYVDPSFNESRQQVKAAALARAAAGAEEERQNTLARRQVIEKRKQEASTALALKEKDEAAKKLMRAQQAQKAETQRLAEEQREREKKRIQAEQERIKREEIERQLKELQAGTKLNIEIPTDLSALDSTRIRALKLQALEKEKNALGDQLRITGKRIDHLERAYRREEVKHLQKDYDTQMENDKKSYDKAKEETLTEAREKHDEAVKLKHRLSRLIPHYQSYVDSVRDQRKAEFEKRKKAAEKEFQARKQARVKEVRERRAKERREHEEAERKAREEEERLRREEEEREKAEEEKRQRMLEEKQKREEERKRLDEVAEKQRAREAEAEARRAARKTTEPAPPARAEPSAGGPPRLALSGNQPSWRDREASKTAVSGSGGSGATSEPAQEPSAEAPKRGGYVPPALRKRQDGGGAPSGGWRAREGSGRGPLRDDDRSRNESPASRATSGRYQTSGARNESPGPDKFGSLRRTQEPRESAPPAASGSSEGGKYRPGAFQALKEQQ